MCCPWFGILWTWRDLTRSPPRAEGSVRIAHAPNHRGPKGTQYLLAAVDHLRQDGHDIEMVLIEGKTNDQVLEIMRDVDIFVDQLIFGYALRAIEGMALGKVVITGYEPDAPYYQPFRRFSYFDECPAIAAGPDTIYQVLGDLLGRREEWADIGRASRHYAESRHSYHSSAVLFEAIYEKIWDGQDIDLKNFYTPVSRTNDTGGVKPQNGEFS